MRFLDESRKSSDLGDMNQSLGYFPCLTNAHGEVIGRAGDRVVAHHPLFDHPGTINYDGRVWACSWKFNGIRLVSFEDFSGGQPVTNQGNIGNKSREEILNHYRMIEGDGYGLLTKNCEHIDNHVRGLGYSSPQVALALTALFAGAMLYAVTKRS